MQLDKYLKLDQKGKIMAEYVWVDAIGETRSKSRVSANSLVPPKATPSFDFFASSSSFSSLTLDSVWPVRLLPSSVAMLVAQAWRRPRGPGTGWWRLAQRHLVLGVSGAKLC